jgi:hypothetical protein
MVQNFDLANGLEGLERDQIHQILNELDDFKVVQKV